MERIADILSRTYSLRTALDVLRVLSDEQLECLIRECNKRRDNEALRVIREARRRLSHPDREGSGQSDLELIKTILVSARYKRTVVEVSWGLDSPEWNRLNQLLVAEGGEEGLAALDALEWAIGLRTLAKRVPAQDSVLTIDL